ncbi:MAG: hypothetical protein KAR19_13030 [Bacteroidales bacterium]|nr:hypothetical protein [Bacteroidales bacterium]
MKMIRIITLLSGLLLVIPVLSFSQEKQKPFKLAIAQMSVVGGDRKANLKHAGEMISEAAEQGEVIL